jgi:hypothetical protein
MENGHEFPRRRSDCLMRVLEKRLRRLEDQLGAADGKPRKRFPTMIQPHGRGKIDLDNSTCHGTLCADGTVSESIFLVGGHNARQITDAKLEAWIDSFPIEVPDGCIRPTRRLPSPE